MLLCLLLAASLLSVDTGCLAEEEPVQAERCGSHSNGERRLCNDENDCTFDFFDSLSHGCVHLPRLCSACKQHGSYGKAVDFVVLLPRLAAHNSSFGEAVGGALTSLLRTATRNRVEARLSVVVYAAGGPTEIALGFTSTADGLKDAVSSSLRRRTVWTQSASTGEGLGYNAAVQDALSAVFSVWSNGSFLLQMAETDGGDVGAMHIACETHLGVRHAADLHVLLFLAGSTILPSSDQDVTRLLDRLVTVAMETQKKDIRNELSLSVFIDTALARTGVDAFGDPNLDESYLDKSHFNRAATLKALIHHGSEQASSLQAYLLSKSVHCRVFDVSGISEDGIIRSLHRTVLEPPHVTCSQCRQATCSENVGCVRQKLHCPEDSFCSPVLGCVKKNLAQPSVPAQPLIFFSNAYRTLSWREALQTRPVPVREWSPDKRFVADLIAAGQPVVLCHTAASKWPALTKWSDDFFRRALPELLLDVKRTSTSLTFDPDRSAAMAILNSITMETPYSVHNMSRDDFVNVLNEETVGHYYFTGLPENLKADLTRARFLFAEERDFKLRRHFLWISSRGMVTHTHFDQDYNFFVQLSGNKTFTLWPAEDHEQMYTYPRIHPMWHKSQVDPANPDYDRFPLFSRARSWRAELRPGDMLYIPPYTWHHVVSETRSVSVSSYSHDYAVRTHMNAVYKHDHKFDLIGSKRGKMFVLRLYLDMLIHELFGKGETDVFFVKLLATRYRGLEAVFPVRADHPRMCRGKRGLGFVPTAQHIYGYASLDMKIVAQHFQALPAVTRDVLFTDYVEEITAQVVGVEDTYAFFRYCFQGQEYYVTNIDDEEHALWDHADEDARDPSD